MNPFRSRLWLMLAMALQIAGCQGVESPSRAEIGGLDKPLSVILGEFEKWGGCRMQAPSAVFGMDCNLQGDGFEIFYVQDKAGQAFVGQPYSVQLSLRTSDENEGKVSSRRKAEIIRFVEYFVSDWPEAAQWLSAAIDKVNRGKLADCPEFIRVRGIAVMIQKDMLVAGERAVLTITRESTNKNLTTLDVLKRCNLCGYNKGFCLMNYHKSR
ncbi:hypothetical protein [Sphingomonas sp. ERG5]|uniref:hypothetical protein n=1 Tax=Sphingomonas sp. ERG5 TaxID=1381597 RepID=UPI00054BF83F|nr:hypothetical protein [Sphingomonas sp. ERG5]